MAKEKFEDVKIVNSVTQPSADLTVYPVHNISPTLECLRQFQINGPRNYLGYILYVPGQHQERLNELNDCSYYNMDSKSGTGARLDADDDDNFVVRNSATVSLTKSGGGGALPYIGSVAPRLVFNRYICGYSHVHADQSDQGESEDHDNIVDSNVPSGHLVGSASELFELLVKRHTSPVGTTSIVPVDFLWSYEFPHFRFLSHLVHKSLSVIPKNPEDMLKAGYLILTPNALILTRVPDNRQGLITCVSRGANSKQKLLLNGNIMKQVELPAFSLAVEAALKWLSGFIQEISERIPGLGSLPSLTISPDFINQFKADPVQVLKDLTRQSGSQLPFELFFEAALQAHSGFMLDDVDVEVPSVRGSIHLDPLDSSEFAKAVAESIKQYPRYYEGSAIKLIQTPQLEKLPQRSSSDYDKTLGFFLTRIRYNPVAARKRLSQLCRDYTDEQCDHTIYAGIPSCSVFRDVDDFDPSSVTSHTAGVARQHRAEELELELCKKMFARFSKHPDINQRAFGIVKDGDNETKSDATQRETLTGCLLPPVLFYYTESLETWKSHYHANACWHAAFGSINPILKDKELAEQCFQQIKKMWRGCYRGVLWMKSMLANWIQTSGETEVSPDYDSYGVVGSNLDSFRFLNNSSRKAFMEEESKYFRVLYLRSSFGVSEPGRTRSLTKYQADITAEKQILVTQKTLKQRIEDVERVMEFLRKWGKMHKIKLPVYTDTDWKTVERVSYTLPGPLPEERNKRRTRKASKNSKKTEPTVSMDIDTVKLAKAIQTNQ